MPTPKITLNLLVCASLALAGASLYAQSSTGPSTPSSATPQQTSPAPTTPAPTAQQTPDASASTPQSNTQSTQDCQGPVLHRAPDKGGDICSTPTASPVPSSTDEDSTPVVPGKNGQTDPNVNPFPQAQPDKDGNMPGVKGGSIDDVNAVGTRSIGARGMGNWYSTESEIKMGKQYADEVEKSTKFITDPVVVEYVNRIGQNIVKNSDCKVPFTIKVIDSDEINAMALPGGFFYVNSGLILAADEESELAGVMAHETAHVCAHHAAREQTKLNYAEIGMIPVMVMLGGTWTGYGIYEASQLAIPMGLLEFSREYEAEADWLGVQYMYKAGYDPQAFIEFFEKIDALEKHKPGTLAKVFADHPQTPDRIMHSEEEIATILPARPDYVVTTSEFDDVKSRLARIENKRKLNDKGKGNTPTLRRVGANDPNSPTGTSTSDDRPTLGQRN